MIVFFCDLTNLNNDSSGMNANGAAMVSPVLHNTHHLLSTTLHSKFPPNSKVDCGAYSNFYILEHFIPYTYYCTDMTDVGTIKSSSKKNAKGP